MKKTLYLAAALMALAPVVPTSDYGKAAAQGTILRSKDKVEQLLTEAQILITAHDYSNAREKLIQVLQLDSSNEKAHELIDICNAELQQDDNSAYDDFYDACDIGTIDAFEAFLDRHPDGEYAEQAHQRIEELKLWNAACAINTEEGYRKYLEESAMKLYEREAQAKITLLVVENEWRACFNEGTSEAFEAFARKYPYSEHKAEAEYYITLYKAEEHYEAGDYSVSIELYEKANAFRRLSGKFAQHYEEMREEQTAFAILSSTNAEEVKRYLESHTTDSRHYEEVSNHYAVLLASSLNGSSTEADFDRVLYYSRSPEARTLANNSISRARKERKNNERQQRRAHSGNWWEGRHRMGWQLIGADTNEYNASFASNFNCRLGRHSDVFNFIIGLGYAYQGVVEDGGFPIDMGDETLERLAHQVTVPARIHFNMGGRHHAAAFFIGAGAEFAMNFGENNFLLNDYAIAIQPEIGVCGKHVEWGIFYKRYLDDFHITDQNYWNTDWLDQRFGTYFTVYF